LENSCGSARARVRAEAWKPRKSRRRRWCDREEESAIAAAELVACADGGGSAGGLEQIDGAAAWLGLVRGGGVVPSRIPVIVSRE